MSETQKESWGAWKKPTAKGEVIKFTLGGQRYAMWSNSYKKDEKHPDYVIYKDDYVPQNNIAETAQTEDLPF